MKLPEKEWFNLEEVAALLKLSGPDGQPLAGHKAEQAVLELIFDKGNGERYPLIPSVLFTAPVLVKQYLSKIWRSEGVGCASLGYKVKIKGVWPRVDQRSGFPLRRFRYVVPRCPYWHHPFEVAITPAGPVEFTGLLHLWLYGQPRSNKGTIMLDKSGIETKRAFPSREILWYDPAFYEYPTVEVIAFERVMIDGIEQRPICKTINENELVITRRSLVNYAVSHGYVDTLRLLAGAGDEVEKPTSLNIGGRPPGYLTEALEHAYLKCLESGNISILEPHQLEAFLKHLHKLSGGSRNKEGVSEYISERIDVVQPSNQTECVKIYECAVEGRPYKKSEWYSQNSISTRMSTLRGKYPLPPQKNIQEPMVSES